MDLAKHVASWSKDPRTKVGAVVVGRPGEVSLGYNGFPRGVEDTEERLNNRALKHKYTQHAERNVLDNTRFDTNGATLYVTMFPCSECAKSIINKGITCVVCPPPSEEEPWKSDAEFSRVLFEEGGVRLSFLGEARLTNLSTLRIGELLDYATNYGDFDESDATIDGLRRDTIRAYKELLRLRGVEPNDRYSEEE